MTEFEENKILYAYEDTGLNEAIETLKTADEAVPVESNNDWRKGVITASNNYKKKKLIVQLSRAYEHYRFRVQTGLALENDTNRFYEWKEKHRTQIREIILEGRALCGEPKDLNF